MKGCGEGFLLERASEDNDLLIFHSIREQHRKLVKDMTRKVIIVNNQAWLEQSSLGNSTLQEVRLQGDQWVIHVEAILSKEQYIWQKTGQHL